MPHRKRRTRLGRLGKGCSKPGSKSFGSGSGFGMERSVEVTLSKTTLVGIRNGFGRTWSWPELTPNASWESWRKTYWNLLNRCCNLPMWMGEPTNNKGKRQLRDLMIYRKICLFIQSETGRRFIETIFSVIATKKYNGVNPLHYIKSCIESFRLNRSAPRLIPAWCGPNPVVC